MKRATPTRAVVFDLDGTLLDSLSVVLKALRHALEPFAAVVCGDDLPTHKPEPEGLRDILRRLQVTPAETLLVGDADVDVLGGRVLRGGYSPHSSGPRNRGHPGPAVLAQRHDAPGGI